MRKMYVFNMFLIHVLLIVVALLSVACKPGGDDKASVESEPAPRLIDAPTDPANPEIDTSNYEDERVDVANIESNFYVKDGSANHTTIGDVIEFDGNTYKRAIWDYGDVFVEHGTFEVEARDVFDHEEQVISSEYVIIFTPNYHNPNDCDYSMDSYEQSYEWESNGAVITQHVHFDSVYFVQAFGWPTHVQPDTIEGTHTAECL